MTQLNKLKLNNSVICAIAWAILSGISYFIFWLNKIDKSEINLYAFSFLLITFFITFSGLILTFLIDIKRATFKSPNFRVVLGLFFLTSSTFCLYIWTIGGIFINFVIIEMIIITIMVIIYLLFIIFSIKDINKKNKKLKKLKKKLDK